MFFVARKSKNTYKAIIFIYKTLSILKIIKTLKFPNDKIGHSPFSGAGCSGCLLSDEEAPTPSDTLLLGWLCSTSHR